MKVKQTKTRKMLTWLVVLAMFATMFAPVFADYENLGDGEFKIDYEIIVDECKYCESNNCEKTILCELELEYPYCELEYPIKEEDEDYKKEGILPALFSPFSIAMIVPASTPFEEVDNWVDLQAAIAGASGSVDIRVMADITATGEAIVIPAGLDVYLRSNPYSVNIYSIYQNATDTSTIGLYRHFRVEGTLYFDNITITRNAALTTLGGGILIYETGRVEMFDGSVVSNNRANRGGGVYSEGTLNMSGGTIEYNIATVVAGGVHNAGIFNLSGSAVIRNNDATFVPAIFLIGDAQLNMSGGDIREHRRPISMGFNNDVTTLRGNIVAQDNVVITMSGGYIRYNSAIQGATAISMGGASRFYMTGGEISNNDTRNISGGLVHGVVTVWSNAVMIMSDNALITNNTAIQHTADENSLRGGSGILVRSGGTAYMYGGEISNNYARHGGGVNVGYNAIFTMIDGTITGNEAFIYGGGVMVGGTGGTGTNATFNMSGGIIYGNTGVTGGGVHVYHLQNIANNWVNTFNMTGGTIDNNTATASGGGVSNARIFNLSGDAIIQGNNAPLAPAIRVFGTAEFNMSGGTVTDHHNPLNGYLRKGNILVIDNATMNMSGGFITENSAIAAATAVTVAGNAKFYLSGGEITHNITLNQPGGFVHGVVTVFDNAFITVSDDALIAHNRVMLNPAFDAPNPINIDARRGGTGITLRDGGNGYMSGGRIYDNTGAQGGGVSIGLGSLFTMSGGEIIGNHAYGNGGGVLVTGTLNMYDGLISDNTSANEGGGINIHNPGVININGGVITGNTATTNGGGIHIRAGGTASITPIESVEITNNTAANNGGGIFTVSYTNLSMVGLAANDGVIFNGNTAATAHNLWAHPAYPKTLVPAADSGGGTGGSIANIDWATVSIPGTHVLNNFDINYIGYEIDILTFNPNGGIFASLGSTPQVRVIEHDGANPIFYSQAFNAQNNLINPALPHPTRTNHTFGGWFDTQANANGTTQTGRVLHSDEITDTSTRILWARWTPRRGGNGNGTVEIPDPETPLAELSPYHYAYIIGYPDGYVRPNNNITRAEVATIFFRLISDEFRINVWRQSNPFPDVILQNWFNNAISTLTNANLLYGYPDGYFRPNQSMTRAEFSAVIVRIMGERGAMATATNSFTDVTGHWGEAYISVAYELGWVRGYGDGTFRPDRFISRAEVAALVNRALNRLPETYADLLPDMVIWPDNMRRDAWYYLYIQEATNSHYHKMKPDGIHETWTELIEPREWWRLERPNSDPRIFTGAYIGEGMGMIEE